MQTMLPLRSESMAYPQVKTSTFVSRVQFFMRQHSRAVLATLSLLVFVLVLSSDLVHENAVGSRNGLRAL